MALSRFLSHEQFIQQTSTYLTAQDDGPVLHKDPSWPHGDFAGAHRGRNRGLPLGHGRKTRNVKTIGDTEA